MFEPKENRVNELQITWYFICIHFRTWKW